MVTIIGITIFPLLQNQREDADFTIYHSEIPQGLLYFYATFEKINIRLKLLHVTNVTRLWSPDSAVHL